MMIIMPLICHKARLTAQWSNIKLEGDINYYEWKIKAKFFRSFIRYFKALASNFVICWVKVRVSNFRMNFQSHHFSQNMNKKLSRFLPCSVRGKSWQFFVHILGETMSSEIHSENYWPLHGNKILQPWFAIKQDSLHSGRT